MSTPYESEEFNDFMTWRQKSKKKLLKPSNCISSWTDICGFGNLLMKNKWDLNSLQKSGLVELLNEVHSIVGKPLLLNVDPFPNDKVIVLNDGIAHTIDLTFKDKLYGITFLFYFRDLLTTHFILLETTKQYNVGVRTILSGGERIQYSPIKTTGQSFLHYNEDKISEFGKSLLDTTFVYNPAEFQMNTAFAKAFTIDSIGSKGNIKVNGLYIELGYLKSIEGIQDVDIEIESDKINLYHKSILVFTLSITEKVVIDLKGLEVEVFHIDKFYIYKEFDGDDLEFPLFRE